MSQDKGNHNLVDNDRISTAGFRYDCLGEIEISGWDAEAQHTQQVEERLIEAARSGNLSAFNRLVVMYQDSLFYWVLSLVKDEDLAEDLAQSTFITAYEKLYTFHSSSFRSWLFKIARNRCIDEFRRQKRMPSISLDAYRDDTEEESGGGFTLLSVLSSDVPLPEEVVERNERSELISRLLEALPEGFRQILQLIDVEDLDYQEVSELLQIPLGTVKSRLVRARLKFQELAIQNGLLTGMDK